MMASPKAHLQNLWANSYERWLLDGKSLVLCPLRNATTSAGVGAGDCDCAGDCGQTQNPPCCVPIPSILQDNYIYLLTAWNPLGQVASAEQNIKQGHVLEQDFQSLSGYERPLQWWYSTGFSHAWREDGFGLLYTPKHAMIGKQVVLALAHKYQQGSIYEYRPMNTTTTTIINNRLQRFVVPVKLTDVESQCEMILCEHVEDILKQYNLH